jgi:hypothetical protein
MSSVMSALLSIRTAVATSCALVAILVASGRQPDAAAGAADQPAACPLRFDARTVGLPKTCLFVGQYNGSCGQSALAIFAGNGDTLVVGFAFSQAGATTYFGGDVDSNTSATLAVWQTSMPVPSASSVSGTVTLENQGQLLRVRMADSPFQVDGCEFGEYVGRFLEMVDAGESIAPAELPGTAAPVRPQA